MKAAGQAHHNALIVRDSAARGGLCWFYRPGAEEGGGQKASDHGSHQSPEAMTNLKKRLRRCGIVTEVSGRRDWYSQQRTKHRQKCVCRVSLCREDKETTPRVNPAKRGEAEPPHTLCPDRQIAPTMARLITPCVSSEMMPAHGPVGFARPADAIAANNTTPISPPIEKRNERITVTPGSRGTEHSLLVILILTQMAVLVIACSTR